MASFYNKATISNLLSSDDTAGHWKKVTQRHIDVFHITVHAYTLIIKLCMLCLWQE